MGEEQRKCVREMNKNMIERQKKGAY